MNLVFKYLNLLFIFLIFSTYTPNYTNQNNSFFFPIKEIQVEGHLVIKKKKLIGELDYLMGRSIFYIDENKINLSIKKFDFIKNFKIKKIYPNTLKFMINEIDPVALYFDKKKLFFLTEDGQSIKYLNLEKFSKLPTVIGKKDNFKIFYQNLKKTNFKMSQIISYRHFEIGRWDIVLEDKRVIKLPANNYLQSINNFLLIKNKNNFEKYKIFDYRIKDQLILK
jgi:cell division septal protein FtsQ